ncbi:hypothetical protein F5B19DRAFT_500534 [Rostrohypoxylon terebratum]|nr:hypothetical protein F5B19DRAFT_500534 [Rostrohypoxylon terebratum]
MSRKRNRNRHPKGHGDNRWGTGTVGFDGDHLMQGVDPPPTNRSPANRRGGQPFPARGRGAQSYRNGNIRGVRRGGGQAQRNPFNRNHHHNAPNPNTNQRKHRNNNRNNNNHRNAPSPSSHPSDPDILLTTPPPLPFAGSLFPPSSSTTTTTTTPFPPPNHSHPHHDGHGRGAVAAGGGNRSRFCTECSAVRRANLRFRNWAAHALRACGDRFREWAEDVGVGFESADEMDWQPEPVTRVLLVGAADPRLFPAFPHPHPHPHSHLPGQNPNPNQNQNQNQNMGPNLNLGGNPKFAGPEAEQYLELLKQKAGGGDGGGGGIGVGAGVGRGAGNWLWPGPWPWPPYENPTTTTYSARVPLTALPKPPTTLEDVSLPDCSPAYTSTNTNTNPNNTNLHANANASNFNLNASIGNPMPVSGFGMLGIGATSCAGCAAEEREAKLGSTLGAAEKPPVPAWEPPQMPAVTSTCGPTKVDVSSARPLGQSFAAYRGRSASGDSEGMY